MLNNSIPPRRAGTGTMLVLAFGLVLGSAQPAHAQFLYLHAFTGGNDGGYPTSIAIDPYGNLFGTTVIGGTVFQSKNVRSGRTFATLTSAWQQPAGVTIHGGVLYGATEIGGLHGSGCDTYGCGLVFRSRPPAQAPPNAIITWSGEELYEFTGIPDGASPSSSLLVDNAGNLFGTTLGGGPLGRGTVYKLTPTDGGWTKSTLYAFTAAQDGTAPYGGVIMDAAGNLYGTTASGTSDYFWGTVYKLTPSGSGWTETILYAFQDGNDGASPVSGLIFDPAGNLYGTTAGGGEYLDGTAFELIPHPSGNWSFSLVYPFQGSRDIGNLPLGPLAIDAAGNLYGASYNGGAYEMGSVYELSPSGGSWTYTSLHDFTGGVDGGGPISGVVLDTSGNIYGSASAGGTHGDGVLFEIQR